MPKSKLVSIIDTGVSGCPPQQSSIISCLKQWRTDVDIRERARFLKSFSVVGSNCVNFVIRLYPTSLNCVKKVRPCSFIFRHAQPYPCSFLFNRFFPSSLNFFRHLLIWSTRLWFHFQMQNFFPSLVFEYLVISVFQHCFR